MRWTLWFSVSLLLAVVVGCGAPQAPAAQPGQSPAVQPTGTPLVSLPEGAEELVQTARVALAKRLQQADEAIGLIDVEPAKWPTSAMGCPQANQMYAQVVTPGYIIRLRAGGNVYEVHVSESGQVAFCESGEGAEKMKVPADAEPAVLAARRDLASRMGVAVEDVQMMEFQAVDWPDSSLGCPEPGKMYLQVITPGYRVVLQAAGQTYEYHTNQGNRAVLCEKGATGLPSSKLRLGELRSVVERARNDLAHKLGVEPAAIQVVEALPILQVEQPAPCPEAGQLVGGGSEYQIVLTAGGTTYVYRARGASVVLCTQ